jgi:hypothetical protein
MRPFEDFQIPGLAADNQPNSSSTASSKRVSFSPQVGESSGSSQQKKPDIDSE